MFLCQIVFAGEWKQTVLKFTSQASPAVLISVWQRHVYCDSPGFSIFLEVSCLFMCFSPYQDMVLKKNLMIIFRVVFQS